MEDTTSSAGDSAIIIHRAAARSAHSGASEFFTGAVRVEPLFAPLAPSRLAGASVTFHPGAHTAWHRHPLGQTLIVTHGVGWVQSWGGPIEEIRRGDVVQIPAGVKHWHGATRTSSMTHIALQETRDGKPAEWLDKVSDAEYEAASGSAAAQKEPSALRKSLGTFAPRMVQLTDDVLFGDVWERPELAPRDRSLITVAALTAGGNSAQLPFHLKKAVENGLTPAELVEALTHLAFYCGWPRALTALEVARRLFQDETPPADPA